MHMPTSIGSTCVNNPSAPDYNRNGICETILHSSSINTPISRTYFVSQRVYTSGNFICSSSAISCSFSTTWQAGGNINFSISGNAGATSVISATVGFSSGQSYAWSVAHGNTVHAPPGTTWYYWIDATGTGYSGNYNAEFWEMKGGWTLVGRYSYGSWTARKYTSNVQAWSRR